MDVCICGWCTQRLQSWLFRMDSISQGHKLLLLVQLSPNPAARSSARAQLSERVSRQLLGNSSPPLQSSYISVNLKKEPAWQEDRIWFCDWGWIDLFVCVWQNEIFPDILKPSFPPHHRHEARISVTQIDHGCKSYTHRWACAHQLTHRRWHHKITRGQQCLIVRPPLSHSASSRSCLQGDYYSIIKWRSKLCCQCLRLSITSQSQLKIIPEFAFQSFPFLSSLSESNRKARLIVRHSSSALISSPLMFSHYII